MRGTFRRDVELVSGPHGSLRLRRRLGPRLFSIALVVVASVLAVLDARIGKTLLAVLQGALALGFVGLLLRAELDRFVLDGASAVRRWVSLTGVREARLDVKSIARVGVERAGKRARAWLETTSGDRVALVDGDAAQVERMADAVANAVRFAAAERQKTELH